VLVSVSTAADYDFFDLKDANYFQSKAPSSLVRQHTLTVETDEVPREWIFSTASVDTNCNPTVEV